MRTFLFLAVLFAGFVFAIVAGYKPALIDKAADDIKRPLVEWQASREETAWRAAKDESLNRWMRKLELPGKCAAPKSAVQQLECKNLVDLHKQTFEKIWRRKVADGWKPDSV